ncbi:hypothetical protein [Massilia rubra]|uniref:Uncharacterized protein n=1 Tax=Massilia rubra TaxID=2607910 RepID=A0ABX0LG92_9BURK|nr:hypothetical protein [Massilia rubra]NHZ33719.1 hypothetical protein [Massilia rubra]
MFTRLTTSPLLRLALLGALCGAGAPACAALSFDLRIDVKNTPDGSGAKVPPDELLQFKVLLGERYISLTNPSESLIYDMAKRRRYRINLAQRSYVDYSLFDQVGFRTAELKYRASLGGNANTPGTGNPGADRVYDEHNLSVASSTRKLSESADGDAVVLAVDGHRLARLNGGGAKVSANDAALFGRMMHYLGGHPLILARLQAGQRIPASFVMDHTYKGYQESRTYTVGALTQSAPASYDLAPYKPRAPQGDDIDQVLDKAQLEAAPKTAADRQAAYAESERAFAEKRPLDGLLSKLAWFYSSGEPAQDTSAEQKAQLNADPHMRELTALLQPPTTKAQFEAALRQVQEMRKYIKSEQHVLTMYEASYRTRLGERREGAALYASVLRAHPGIAMAYAEMGNGLYESYDIQRAWRSWDAGRRIVNGKDSGFFDVVNELEQKLLREHPEYF